MTIVGYTRIARTETDSAAKCEALRAAGCDEVTCEYATSDRRHRPRLAQTIARLRPGDALLAASLDCVAWSLPQLLSLLTALHERNIAFRALDNPIDTSGMNGPIILDTLRAVLSFDDALAKSRIRRDPLPTPATPRSEIVEMVAKLASERPRRGLRQIAAGLKSLGYTPPQGGDHWAPATVNRLLQQAKMTGLLVKK